MADREPQAPVITALATPPGNGGVAVIRLCGEGAARVFTKVFSRASTAQDAPRQLIFGAIQDALGRELDRGLGVWFPGPHSFTGEDTAELHIHGGAMLAAQVLAATVDAGARPAEPGEFTRRAFTNGKIDLTQAEAVAALIGAASERALARARRQLAGELAGEAEALRTGITSVLAELEAHIDFPEEDIAPAALARLGAEIAGLGARAHRLAGTFAYGRLEATGIRCALAGPPNAGKSSLLNALAGAPKAIVTALPGTTRDAIEVAVDIQGFRVTFVDTAGLREAADEIERLGIALALKHIGEADAVLWVFDGSAPPAPEAIPPAACAPGARAPLQRRILCWNKADLPAGHGHSAVEARLGADAVVPVSATTGAGLEALRAAVVRAATAGLDDGSGGTVIVRERHRAALLEFAEGCGRARAILETRGAPELAAADLRDAALAAASITGVITNDDVLDAVFSKFCIGK